MEKQFTKSISDLVDDKENVDKYAQTLQENHEAFTDKLEQIISDDRLPIHLRIMQLRGEVLYLLEYLKNLVDTNELNEMIDLINDHFEDEDECQINH